MRPKKLEKVPAGVAAACAEGALQQFFHQIHQPVQFLPVQVPAAGEGLQPEGHGRLLFRGLHTVFQDPFQGISLRERGVQAAGPVSPGLRQQVVHHQQRNGPGGQLLCGVVRQIQRIPSIAFFQSRLCRG